MNEKNQKTRIYAMRAFGIDIAGMERTGLTHDESLLLAKIREYRRRSQFVETVRYGGGFEVDEELSMQCCSHGWN